jgi:hypothetical protein
MRNKDMRTGKSLGPNDRLQTWSKPLSRPAHCPWKKRAWNKLSGQLKVRVVRVNVERKGFRTRWLWIATTLSDARLYPAAQIAELYHRRWSIELFYRDEKTSMHMEVLRTKSPAIIEKELLMHAIAYNARRSFCASLSAAVSVMPHGPFLETWSASPVAVRPFRAPIP